MPTQDLMTETSETESDLRTVQLQRALERETEMTRRQQLLKELWKLNRQSELAAAEVCQTATER